MRLGFGSSGVLGRVPGWLCSFWCAGILLAGQAGPASAGAWTLVEGQGQVILATTFVAADRMFDDRGRPRPVPDYRKFELGPFLEYGVTDWLTAIAAPVLQSVSAGRPERSYEGPGYSEFGARFRLLHAGPAVFSVQATGRLPGPSDRRNPAEAGNTEPEGDLRALFGSGFALGRWTGFLDGQVGYRARAGAPPDELRGDLTLGLRPAPGWLVLAQSFNVVAAGAGGPGFPAMRYHKVQASVVRELGADWSAQLGLVATVAGRNALRERGIIAAAWRRF